ncbi:MAG: hypothetical protein Q6373_017180 [Candidatus Sigynarchaeota archaeon]
MPRKDKIIMLLFGAVLLTLLLQGITAWRENGIAVCTAPSNQDNVAICPDGQGGSFIAWIDRRNGTEDIFMQRLSPEGGILWSLNGINVSRGGSGIPDYNVRMVKASGDGVIIAWTRDGGTGADIYAQKVSNTGVTYWATNGVPACTSTANQDLACLCSDGAGGAIIAWRDLRNGNYDIYAQRVNASGFLRWNAGGIPVCTAAGNQLDPVICSDGAGGAIIAWDDSRGNNDVYAQRLNASGFLQWDMDGVPACNIPTSSQQNPQLCSDGAGGAIIAWEDMRVDGDGDIYAQRLLPSGVPAWTANGTAICTVPGAQIGATIVASESGGAFIAWEDQRDALHNVAYIQHISGPGAVQWAANGIPLSHGQHNCYQVRVCSDGQGGAFATWGDDPGIGPAHDDIYAQRIGPTGTIEWETNGRCICCADDMQNGLAIICVNPGRAIIAWEDYRSGTNWDIYAQQVEIVPQDDWTLTIVLVVVAIAVGAAAVMLFWLYKKGKLKRPRRPAPPK